MVFENPIAEIYSSHLGEEVLTDIWKIYANYVQFMYLLLYYCFCGLNV